MDSERVKGHLLIFSSHLIFGLNYPISKWLLSTHLTPDFYMSARLIVACALFWALSLFLPRERLSLKEIGVFFLCSIGCITGNQLLFVWGLDMTSPIDASIINAGRPLLVLVLATLILRERFTQTKAAGMLLGAAGAIWLILQAATGNGGNASSLLGNVFIFLSCFVYALYFVFSKPLSEKYQATTMMKWMLLFAAVQVLPFSVPAVLAEDAAFLAPLDAKAVAAMIFVFVGTSFLGYLLIPMGLKRIRATTASMYNNIHPIIAAVVALALGQDVLSLEKILAAAAVFSGLYLVSRSRF